MMTANGCLVLAGPFLCLLYISLNLAIASSLSYVLYLADADATSSDATIDILGVVCTVEPAATYVSAKTGKEGRRTALTVGDESGASVKVTCFGSAEEEPLALAVGTVVAIAGARQDDWRGEPRLDDDGGGIADDDGGAAVLTLRGGGACARRRHSTSGTTRCSRRYEMESTSDFIAFTISRRLSVGGRGIRKEECVSVRRQKFGAMPTAREFARRRNQLDS